MIAHAKLCRATANVCTIAPLSTSVATASLTEVLFCDCACGCFTAAPGLGAGRGTVQSILGVDFTNSSPLSLNNESVKIINHGWLGLFTSLLVVSSVPISCGAHGSAQWRPRPTDLNVAYIPLLFNAFVLGASGSLYSRYICHFIWYLGRQM